MATDAPELTPVGAQAAAGTGLDAGAAVGRSSSRRTVGLAGQYAVLVVLAAIVLVPVFFALIQALSPPFSYVNAHKPLHPVDITWKARTWFSGGPLSVIGRTLLVVLALAWVH